MSKLQNFFDSRIEAIKKEQIRNSKGLKLHIKYLLHKNKSDDTFTIYHRITYQGKQSDITTGVRCKKEEFNRAKTAVKGNDFGSQFLRVQENAIIQAFANLKLSGKEFAVADIRNQVLGISINNDIPSILGSLEMFLQYLIIEHNTNGYAAGTLRKYKMWHNRMSEFFTYYYGKKGSLDKIQSYDIQAFISWLKTERKYKNNPAQYIAGHFIRFCDFCISNKFMTSNPFILFRRKFEDNEVIYLTKEEIELLEQTKIYSDGLERVRDTFLFMYELGVNYADIASHTRADLHTNTNGNVYFIKPRTKTGQEQVVPLSERAKRLIDKYKDDLYSIERNQLVPVITSEIMNRYLKQVAEICGIKTHLSTKRARTSRITHLWDSGANEERIQLMAGHRKGSNITHKHYISHAPNILMNRIEKIPENA